MLQHPLKHLSACFFFVLLAACSGATKIRSVNTEMIGFSSRQPLTDSTAYYLVAPYKSQIDKIMNEELCTSDSAFIKDLPEGTLGNFVADAILHKANEKYFPADGKKADICLLNNGGLRAQLPKGTITRGNVYELMPFENKIVILTLTGERTKMLFQSLVNFNGAPFAGARVSAKGKKISMLQIGGKDFDENKTYKIITSDYLAGGGDKYDFFKDPVQVDSVNYLLRDAIIDEMKEAASKGIHIRPFKDGRIIYE